MEKRSVFLDNFDHRRFLISLEELNQEGPLSNFGRLNGAELQSSNDEKNKLVDIICYCLMPNHFHLIMKQLIDNGIPKFMHKIGTSYTNYFNKKYSRSGVLFQGAYKIKYIDGDAYLLHLSRYIHLNPLEMMNSSKSRGKDWEALVSYPWSSLPGYLYPHKKGIIKLETNIVRSQFQGIDQYRDFLQNNGDDGILEHLKLD